MFATVIAMVLEELGSALLGSVYAENSLPYNVIMYFVIVAFSEEGAKYILLRRRTWCSDAFNCQFDGVVYAVFVSLGFALWENLGYVAMYGLSTALVRAVTAVPGHACFGVFMGVYYGRAKRYDNDGDFVKAKRCRTMAVLMPALLHGAYDFIATMEDPSCEWVFLVFVLALFAVSLKLVVRVGSRSDRYIDGGEVRCSSDNGMRKETKARAFVSYFIASAAYSAAYSKPFMRQSVLMTAKMMTAPRLAVVLS